MPVAFAGAALLTVTMACAPEPARPRTFGAAEIAKGQALFETNGCPACHGHEGHGDGQLARTLTPTPRDFRHPDAFKGPRSIDAVATVIARGLPAFPTPMPALNTLDQETRELIAAYVLSIGSSGPP